MLILVTCFGFNEYLLLFSIFLGPYKLFEAIRPFLRRMFVRCKKSLQRDVILYGLLLLTNRSNSSLLLLPSNDAQITLFFNSLFFDIQYSLSLRNKLFAGWWEIILSSKEKNSLKSSYDKNECTPYKSHICLESTTIDVNCSAFLGT